MKKFYLLLILLCMQNSFANLDTNFSFGNGYVQTSINGVDDEISKIKIQSSDDKIVVAGYSTLINSPVFALARYNTDGSLDSTGFNAGGTQPGVVTTAINGYSLANNLDIQTDDKIVAVGYTFDGSVGLLAIARYTTAGILDTTFNGNGIVTTLIGSTAAIATAVKQKTNGKLVVGGSAIFGVPYFALAQYDTDGSLDTANFNSGGTQPGTITTLVGFSSQGHALAIDADDKIILAGSSDSQFALARYNIDGTLDTTFNSGGVQPGTVTTSIGGSSIITAIAIQTDGKIVAAGQSDNQVALARYNSDGTIDTSYGTNGIVITTIQSSSVANDLKLQSDDKAVITGSYSENASQPFLARYNTDGTPDTSFGTNGIILSSINLNSSANGLDIDTTGRFVIGGFTQNNSTIDFLVARFKEVSNLITLSSPVNDSTVNSSTVAMNGTFVGPNTKVVVFIDNAFTATTTGASGVWDAGNSPALSVGLHTLRADLLDGTDTVVDSTLVSFTVAQAPSLGVAEFINTSGLQNLSVTFPNEFFTIDTTLVNTIFNLSAVTTTGVGTKGTRFTIGSPGTYVVDFGISLTSTTPIGIYTGVNPIGALTLNNNTVVGSATATTWIHGRSIIVVPTTLTLAIGPAIADAPGAAAISAAGTTGPLITHLSIVKVG